MNRKQYIANCLFGIITIIITGILTTPTLGLRDGGIVSFYGLALFLVFGFWVSAMLLTWFMIMLQSIEEIMKKLR